MKKQRIFLMVVLLLSCSAVMLSCREKKMAGERVPCVDVAEAQEDSVVVHKSFPGLVESASAVDVVAQANGRIVKKCFEDGAYVAKGALLYEIDDSQARSDVAEAKAEVAQAQGQHEYYVRQSAAMQRALQGDAVARITVEQAESNVRSSAAALAAARARLNAATIALSYCRVTAPISGHTQGAVEQGSYAAAGSTLVRIVNNNELKVTFSIDESQYNALHGEGLGQQTREPLFRHVPVECEGAGTVYTDLFYVSPSVNVSTGTLTLQGKIINDDGRLKDGMYAAVKLPVSVDAHAILIREAAIGTDLQGKYIYVVNDSDKVVYTPVELGETVRDTLRIVSKGVSRGDRYVTRALLTVKNGMKVKPLLKK